MWCLSTFSALVLLFGYGTSTSGPTGATPSAVYSGRLGGSSPSSPSNPSSPTSPSRSSRPSTGAATVTGAVAQTQWGPVQVAVRKDGATITEVQVLQHPTGNARDDEINSYALPILVQETLDAQSGDIDMVSGATVTSVGYVQSLQSALDRAGA